MADIPFKDWVFQQLVAFGAIKDYEKTPHVGKGRAPKGNLSIQIGRIAELKESSNPNEQVWGLIGYAGLQTDGQIGKRLSTVVNEFCKIHNPSNPASLYDCMEKAAKIANEEFKARYKEKVMA